MTQLFDMYRLSMTVVAKCKEAERRRSADNSLFLFYFSGLEVGESEPDEARCPLTFHSIQPAFC